MPGLLTRQLLFITGKGGVGKTTVAAALGLAAARAGRRTIVCEVGAQQRLPTLFRAKGGGQGVEVELSEGLWGTSIDPQKALEEWLGRQLGSKQLVSVLARSNAFQYFVAAAPGARELVTITKAWELAQAKRWDKAAQGYDLVIVDAPASGHGLGMLSTPKTFADIARVGPIAGQASRVRAFLENARCSGYLAVSLPGEMPVAETLELEAQLAKNLGRPLEAIVVNAVLPRRFSVDELESVAAADGAVPAAALHAARTQAARVKVQQNQLKRLRGQAKGDVVTLPFIFTPQLELADVEELSDELEKRL